MLYPSSTSSFNISISIGFTKVAPIMVGLIPFLINAFLAIIACCTIFPTAIIATLSPLIIFSHFPYFISLSADTSSQQSAPLGYLIATGPF